ncbi:hypothetical protein [Halomonas ramblicola]|uniref:hypothetical protein n=1 Tax=Halomonas ramblicola TaxID=747349 RepID=UPI0025B2C022|nr:hypothetical protein [Halomonas ramblicola]MDN3521260.1 hypothetical protein [Halomonas ramblicola]
MRGVMARKLGLTLAAGLLALGLAACEDDPGPAEEAGQEVDQAMEEAGDNVEEMGDEMEEAAEGE